MADPAQAQPPTTSATPSNGGFGELSDEALFDRARLTRYVDILRKRAWLLLAVFVTGLGLAGLYTLRQPKIYEATATVVVNPQAPRVFGSKSEEVIELGTGSYWSNQEYYNTQLDVIRSFPLALATVNATREGAGQYAAQLVPAAKAPLLSETERVELAATRLKRMISAEQAPESRIIAISIRHVDPDLARDLANTHVESYLAAMRGKRTVGTEKASVILAKEVDVARAQLDAAAAVLYDFRAKNDLGAGSIEGKQSVLSDQISRYTAALTDAQIKRRELESLRTRIKSLQADDVLKSPLFALLSNNDIVESLKAQYHAEAKTFREVASEFGPKSEKYIQQKGKVADVLAAITNEADRAVREVEERYLVAVRTEQGLATELERLKLEASGLGPVAKRYSELAREHDTADASYKEKYAQLQNSQAEGRNELINIEPLEQARAAYLVSPRLSINLMVAGILSLILGISLAFGLEYLDQRIRSPGDVEALTGAPLLGVIPIVPESPGDTPQAMQARDLFVFRNPTSRAAECCRAIRTNILFASTDRRIKTITVSSPRPREGKTTTAIYLGTTMAQSGQRVLVVDTDMRKPRLHKSLGVSKAKGITNLVLGDATQAECIKSTDIPNLFVLPCGPLPPNPAELLLTAKFKAVLDELEKHYDLILLDSPPVLAVTDAVVLARISEGVILVAHAGTTTVDDLRGAARHLRAINAPILGVILNDIDVDDRQYGGYYATYGTYGEPATQST